MSGLFHLHGAKDAKHKEFTAGRNSGKFSTLEVSDGAAIFVTMFFDGELMPAARDMAQVFNAHKNQHMLDLLTATLAAMDDPRNETLLAISGLAASYADDCCDDCGKHISESTDEDGVWWLCKNCLDNRHEQAAQDQIYARDDAADHALRAKQEREIIEAGRGHLIGGA